jgi:hypothetical protein
MKMMCFEDFVEKLQDELEKAIGNVSVHSQSIRKNNGVELIGLSIITEGDPVSPTVYVNDYYNAYTSGVPIEKIASDMAEAYRINDGYKVDMDASKFSDASYVKSNVIYSLINREKNQELLDSAPHRDYLDLSLILKVVMRIGEDGSIASATIRNQHLDMWDISEDELFELAKSNTERLLPAKVMTMSGFMAEIQGGDFALDASCDPMFILTNSNRCNGASVILYRDLLKELSSKLGTALYLIPSSIHEFIAVRADMVDDEIALHSMISQVNSEEVDDTEILSDTLYKYSVPNSFVKVL